MEACALFLKAIQTELNPERKQELEVTAGGILTRVEELKGVKKSGDPGRLEAKSHLATPATGPPSQVRPLSEEEALVLKHSSIINGHVCLPWLNEDLGESFVPSGGGTFTDKLTLKLSPSQSRRFHAWKRPPDFVINPVMIKLISPQAVTQNCVTNCSFVCSLAVAANYERRFNRPLVTSIIYPQSKGLPQINPYGKYMIRLNFNGMPRKVVIDDRLPVDVDGELLTTYSSNRHSFTFLLPFN